MNDLVHTLGPRLHEARRKRGWTLIELAVQCDDEVTFQQLSLYERGLHLPSAPTLVRLALALEVSTDHLLGLDGRDGDRAAA